jgi:hypothetical protein
MARPRKLTDAQVEQAKRLFAEGHTGRYVADFFHISLVTAYNIRNSRASYNPLPAELQQIFDLANTLETPTERQTA